jgi:hypothetical protein
MSNTINPQQFSDEPIYEEIDDNLVFTITRPRAPNIAKPTYGRHLDVPRSVTERNFSGPIYDVPAQGRTLDVMSPAIGGEAVTSPVSYYPNHGQHLGVPLPVAQRTLPGPAYNVPISYLVQRETPKIDWVPQVRPYPVGDELLLPVSQPKPNLVPPPSNESVNPTPLYAGNPYAYRLPNTEIPNAAPVSYGVPFTVPQALSDYNYGLPGDGNGSTYLSPIQPMSIPDDSGYSSPISVATATYANTSPPTAPASPAAQYPGNHGALGAMFGAQSVLVNTAATLAGRPQ